MKKTRIAVLTTLLFVVLPTLPVAFSQTQSAPAAPSIPQEKQTRPGLYLTAKEAYQKWKAAPERVKIVDVRTPEEYMFVGHPEMAWNIPLLLQTYEWDAAKQRLVMAPNPDFVAQVKAVFNPDDTLLVICRSGNRSASAVNLLADAGFKDVYSIIDGVEGDLVQDPESAYNGMRMKNGWKNSGLPWTYRVNPDQMRLPKHP